MKKLSTFLCTLAPWGFYWSGQALNLPLAGVTGALVATALLRGLGLHRLKTPDWTQVIFFTSILAGSLLPTLQRLLEVQSLLAPALFVTMSLGSLLIGKPFTIQYARDEVPVDFWIDPCFPLHFMRVNRILTSLWTSVFAIGLGSASFVHFHQGRPPWICQVLPVLAFLLATWLTRFFPLWYQKNYYEPGRPNLA